MEVLDYARSTITFDHAGVNQARIAVESRCCLARPGRELLETWLVASCKAEQTYGPGQLFRAPNYDFCISTAGKATRSGGSAPWSTTRPAKAACWPTASPRCDSIS